MSRSKDYLTAQAAAELATASASAPSGKGQAVRKDVVEAMLGRYLAAIERKALLGGRTVRFYEVEAVRTPVYAAEKEAVFDSLRELGYKVEVTVQGERVSW